MCLARSAWRQRVDYVAVEHFRPFHGRKPGREREADKGERRETVLALAAWWRVVVAWGCLLHAVAATTLWPRLYEYRSVCSHGAPPMRKKCKGKIQTLLLPPCGCARNSFGAKRKIEEDLYFLTNRRFMWYLQCIVGRS